MYVTRFDSFLTARSARRFHADGRYRYDRKTYDDLKRQGLL